MINGVTFEGHIWFGYIRVDVGNFVSIYFTVTIFRLCFLYVTSNLVLYNVLTCIRQMKCNFDKIFYIKNSACIDEMGRNTMCIKYRTITLMKDIYIQLCYGGKRYCVAKKKTVFEFFMKEQKIHQTFFKMLETRMFQNIILA